MAKGKKTDRDLEKVRALELSRGDVRELLRALRKHIGDLEALSKKLRAAGCHAEADNMDSRCTDWRERLCTQLAAELDDQDLPDDMRGATKEPEPPAPTGGPEGTEPPAPDRS